MSSTLEQIVSHTRSRVAGSRVSMPIAQLEREARVHLPRGFRRTLLQAAEKTGFAIIAELKKASPSKGMIRGSFPVAGLAVSLAEGGANALSVLTEEKWFQGSLQDLREASAATELPCLRKDFIVDEYQLWEARASRADAVLLIVAALPDPDLGRLLREATALQLDVLVEAHDAQEIARAIAVGANMIGVNSRDLKSLQVDSKTHERLAANLPKDVLRVAESGIRSGAEVRGLQGLGYQAFLVGESLMRADHPGEALQGILAEAKALPLGAAGAAASDGSGGIVA